MLEQGVHLHCDLESSADPVVGDPARLTQVFWNLLNNATKFTPEGGDIYLSVRGIDKVGQGRQVRPSRFATRGWASRRRSCRASSTHSSRATLASRDSSAESDLAWQSRRFWSKVTGARSGPKSEGKNKGATFVVELPAMSRERPFSPAATTAEHRRERRAVTAPDCRRSC